MKKMKAVDAPTNIKDQEKAEEFKELKNYINEEKGKVISFISVESGKIKCKSFQYTVSKQVRNQRFLRAGEVSANLGTNFGSSESQS